jgi:DNA-binding transcriptional ArsR family regulator
LRAGAVPLRLNSGAQTSHAQVVRVEGSAYAGCGVIRLYQLIVLLEMGGSMTPSKLAKAAGRSVQTVSGHLAKLRAADVVRYDTAGKEVRYWLKHKGEVQGLLKALHKVVHASTRFE